MIVISACENLLPCKAVAAVDEGTYSSCSVADGCDFSLSLCSENLLPREVVTAVDEGAYSCCYVVDGSDLSPSHTETVATCRLTTQMIQVARDHHLQHHLQGSNNILETDVPVCMQVMQANRIGHVYFFSPNLQPERTIYTVYTCFFFTI